MEPVKLNKIKTTSEDVQPSTTESKKPRKARARITDDLIKQMAQLSAEGYNNKEIAELLDVSGATVGRYLKQDTRALGRRLNGTERNRIVQLRRSGMTFPDIAKVMHCSYSCANRVYREETGLQPTRAKGQRVNRVAEQKHAIITPVHRIGNELHNVDVHESDVSKLDKVEPPLIHPDKVETTNAVLWLVITTVAFILGLGVAGL